jgi:short subunit dehydrogenase-like uncharacterized protein
MPILLYGANGYTGKLIVRQAIKQNLQLLLAGRNAEALAALSEESGFPYQAVELGNQPALQQLLRGCSLVLHAAGPFEQTAPPMLEACLATGTHYLDITGEIPVFEYARSLHERARVAGIVLMPGVGFDVVPTDCMARYLFEKLPDATQLKLAFSALGGGVSRGTATTAVSNLGSGGAVRRNGRIVPVPIGHKTLEVPFTDKPGFCVSIPWGDVSTAFHTTGIPNIETYVRMPRSMHRNIRIMNRMNWLLRRAWVRQLAKWFVRRQAPGPGDEARRTGRSIVWGEVCNSKGQCIQARIHTMEGYTLTAVASLYIAQKVLQGKLTPGYHTPASAFGADLILEMPDSSREDIHS